jgi:transcriptional regulator with XRE-family HTH domain
MARERAFAACRRAAGLDLQRAAARLRMNAQYLRRVELGHSPLSMRLASKMAVVYGTTIRVLTEPAGAGGAGSEGRGAGGSASRPARKRRSRSGQRR